jgi:hypothetical protein
MFLAWPPLRALPDAKNEPAILDREDTEKCGKGQTDRAVATGIRLACFHDMGMSTASRKA